MADSKQLLAPEPLLVPDTARFCLFPIQHPDLFEFYQKAVASFWTAEEIDMSQDATDFEQKLNDNERHFLTMTLAFFANSDGIVQENLASNFLKEVQLSEARQFYSYQIFNEAVHNQVYSLLIDTVIRDQVAKQKLFAAIEQVTTIKEKAQWAMTWLDPNVASFAERLVGFACVELIQFSGSFAAIYWLKQRHKGLMPGLTTSNEFIARDEGLHGQFAVQLYNHHLQNKLPPARVQEIVGDAVEVEERFVTDALPVSLLGMSCVQMCQYIRYVANRLLQDLGVPALYKQSPNPFGFMEQLSLQGKTNFFEKRVSEYQRAGAPMEFTTEDDF